MQNFATQPKIQRKALQKALKSPYIGKHGKRKMTLALEEKKADLALDKELLKKAENIVPDLMIARSQILNELKNKLPEASVRDLIYGLDIITKNILLLQGKNGVSKQTKFSWRK